MATRLWWTKTRNDTRMKPGSSSLFCATLFETLMLAYCTEAHLVCSSVRSDALEQTHVAMARQRFRFFVLDLTPCFRIATKELSYDDEVRTMQQEY